MLQVALEGARGLGARGVPDVEALEVHWSGSGNIKVDFYRFLIGREGKLSRIYESIIRNYN